MSRLPQRLRYDESGLDRIKSVDDAKRWLKAFVREHETMYERLYDHIQHLDPGNNIVDADGTLADITTQFNTLLSQLEAQKLLKES